MCQHNTQQSLVAAVWSDNCRVKTLSNYHEPIIVADGLMRKKMGDNDVQEKHQSPVNTPKQNNDYSNTFHQIDKGNMIESRYVLGKQGSKKHGLSPKLLFLFFNMTLNDAYKIYSVFHERKHQQDKNESDGLKQLSMDGAIEELTYSLLQAGGDVRKQAAYHPTPQRDLQFVSNCNEGVKQRSNLDRWLDNDVEPGTIQPEGSAESISATC